ncbi:class II fructose-bisphosphate aldolase [Enterococcus sp. BWB1-3]|uniref:class II fructose-bisphosphate aldolase n=1 Tax=unclassified Enterococcus TaxID=2608891 RepID=UPI001921CC78|nr:MULTISPECIES: class II fructose-bisphosphate aldolase [unclassified Enterococcus]MBL1229095.1 class II fructose-bisphosphate aldolase [Enterococcus sp. BWB1-3]MCB5953490.1 class II fructose-bisphosphate aldolase [Enterococcus sp. CWB-B31]
MLVTSREIFADAKAKYYAVPAPNFFDFSSAKTFISVAELMNRPLILAFAQAHMDLLSLEEAALIGKYLAAESFVPIVLHLDHGTDEAIIKKAIDLGFTSVMIDASQEAFEENIRRTKRVIEYAQPRGVVVEAELGHVGSGENYENHSQSDSIYTDPKKVAVFAAETNVDSLAVSIGTAHGFYKGVPQINFDCLHEIKNRTNIPLVLHGGSSSGDENLHRCAIEGIVKINIFTDLVTGAMEKIQTENPNDYFELKRSAENGMAEVLRHCYQIFAAKE